MATVSDLVLPKLGLTMTEGRLAEWRVKGGDEVGPGDILFVVETDKIANEIEAPAAGRIVEILVAAGETVPVGTALARWTGPGLSTSDEAAAPPPSPSAPGPGERKPAMATRTVATPLARRLAKRGGVDLSRIRGSGPGGRIKAHDVERALQQPVGRAAVASSGAFDLRSGPTPIAKRRPPERVETLAAHRLVDAKAQVPHFYLSASVDVTRLVALREDLREDSASPPTLTHFALRAVARALRELPWANSVWLGDEIVTFGRIDIAIATDTPHGLLVPVLRNVDALNLDEIAHAAGTLVRRARAGALSPDDFGGGAIAVSSLGTHGVDLVVPIINAPQAAILGIGRIRDTFRPDGRGAPVLAKEASVVLSCDHRILDGVKGAELLRTIVSHLQRPGRLMRALASGGP